jgi:hypothetical protein
MVAYLNPCSPVTWSQLPKVIRTSGASCVVDRNNVVDPSGGSVSLSLPTQYTPQTVVLVSNSSTSTNDIVIDGAGQTIDGAHDVTLSASRGCMAFVRNDEANEWNVALLPRLLDGAGSDVRIFTMADLGAALTALGIGGGGPPTYMDIDSEDQLVYRFQDEGSATIANLGALGNTMDMTIDAAGLNTVMKQGVPDNWFGRGLGIAMGTNNFCRAITPAHAPGWTQFSMSTIFTPTRYNGASNIGRVFYKHYIANTWGPPYFGVTHEYGGSPPDFNCLCQSAGPVQQDAHLDGDYALPFAGRVQQVVSTFGADKKYRSYLNGKLVVTTAAAAGSADLGAGQWAIGAVLGPGFVEHFGGIIHEVRVTNTQRSAAWIALQYEAMMGRAA